MECFRFMIANTTAAAIMIIKAALLESFAEDCVAACAIVTLAGSSMGISKLSDQFFLLFS